MKSWVGIVVIMFSFSALSFAQTNISSPRFSRFEILFGVGAARAFEDDLFKIPNDKVAVSPYMGSNIGFLYHFNKSAAIGVHGYGYGATIENVQVTDEITRESYIEKFELMSDNIGLRGQLIASRSNIQPYGYLSLNYEMGSATTSRSGTNNLSGTSFGAGGGVKWMLGDHFALSGEVLGSFGSARWETPFFTNSTGKDFNPSMVGFLIYGSFLWGKR